MENIGTELRRKRMNVTLMDADPRIIRLRNQFDYALDQHGIPIVLERMDAKRIV